MKTKFIKKTGLTIEGLYRINKLFLYKKWIDNDTYIQPRYENFCKTVTDLSPEELTLMLELTKRFNILNHQDLMEEFFCGLYNVPDMTFIKARKFICVPLKKITIDGNFKKEQKSGDQVISEMEGLYKQYDYSEKIIICKKANLALNEFTKEDILCFVDDFIGSGESYIETFESYKKFFKRNDKELSTSNVLAVCAWAMKQGIERCINEDLKIYSERVFKKAISDFYQEDLETKTKCMRNIEEHKCKKQDIYSFGYRHCESLVSINGKTVNNTFPIFWNTQNKTNTFPRYK